MLVNAVAAIGRLTVIAATIGVIIVAVIAVLTILGVNDAITAPSATVDAAFRCLWVFRVAVFKTRHASLYIATNDAITTSRQAACV